MLTNNKQTKHHELLLQILWNQKLQPRQPNRILLLTPPGRPEQREARAI